MGNAQTPQPTWDPDRQSEMATGSAKGAEQKPPGPKPWKEQQGWAQGAAASSAAPCPVLQGVGLPVGKSALLW